MVWKYKFCSRQSCQNYTIRQKTKAQFLHLYNNNQLFSKPTCLALGKKFNVGKLVQR